MVQTLDKSTSKVLMLWDKYWTIKPTPRVERLRKSKPERIKDLVTKVLGYNARFVGLDKSVQDSFIFRTEDRL